MKTPRYDRAMLVGSGIRAGIVSAMLVEAREVIQAFPDSLKPQHRAQLDSSLREIAARHDARPERLYYSLAVTLGAEPSANLFDALKDFGKEEALQRLADAIRALSDRA